MEFIGKQLDDLDDWPSLPDPRLKPVAVEAMPFPPVPPPPYKNKMSKGYWDIDSSPKGKRYEGPFKDQPPGNGRVFLYIDKDKWRVFVHYFTT